MTSTGNDRKPRGRPRVDATHVGVRIPPDQLAALDAFVASQPDPKPSRPEAVRRLIDVGMRATVLAAEVASDPDHKRLRGQLATILADLARSAAANAADHAMTGMEATPEVKAQRRQALTSEPAVAKTRAKRAARE